VKKLATISIGDELLNGSKLDTNCNFISNELNNVGYETVMRLTAGDTKASILSSLNYAIKNADLVTITGGLGPTHDDVTKVALCDYFETSLKYYDDVFNEIQTWIVSLGRNPNILDKSQGEYPENATLLHNSKGTAKGILLSKDGTIVLSMPGVPREMKAILVEAFIPKFTSLSDERIVSLNIKTIGITEMMLFKAIHDVLSLYNDITVAYLPRHTGVTVRLSQRTLDEQRSQRYLDSIALKMKEMLPNQIYAIGKMTLSSVVGALLTKHHLTVSTSESCTGGLVASHITDVPGSSYYFNTSYITYSNEAKIKLLDVSESSLKEHGAVSEETVSQMLDGTLKYSGADYAIAISGIAGPDGGTIEKPVGLVYIACGSKTKKTIKRFQFFKDRIINKEAAASAALNLLRLEIIADYGE
jgi:nicotinamide-nucleotide amidase